MWNRTEITVVCSLRQHVIVPPTAKIEQAGTLGGLDVTVAVANDKISCVAITRATGRFRELAEQTEAEALERGIVVDPEVIDQLLNAKIEQVAELMGITPRTSLGYTPDDFPVTLADAIAATHTQ